MGAYSVLPGHGTNGDKSMGMGPKHLTMGVSLPSRRESAILTQSLNLGSPIPAYAITEASKYVHHRLKRQNDGRFLLMELSFADWGQKYHDLQNLLELTYDRQIRGVFNGFRS